MKSDGSLARATQRLAALAARALPARPERPVFLIGCARSGTSILKRRIALHPDVAGYPSEANHLWHPRSYPWVASDRTRPPLWADPARFSALSLGDWDDAHGRRIASEFGWYQRLWRKPVFLNKSAMVAFILPAIVRLFPDARILHIQREAAAVALSYARKEHAKMQGSLPAYRAAGYAMDFDAMLLRMAANWSEHEREIERARRALALDARGAYFRLAYEDLCAEPEAWLAKTHEFLGLDPARSPREATRGIRSANAKAERELSDAQREAIARVDAETRAALSAPAA
jgi:LPS sulfotransferase NodH